MSVTSWFRFTQLHFPSAVTKPSRRRVPTRPFLEYLEERAVPDAASGNVLGNLNNATINTNLASSGLVLTPNPTFATLNAVALGTFFNGFASLNLGQQGAIVPSNFLNVPTSFLFNAFGFGSGTQPNQPWVPNAYNLGLANGQFAFPSQADFGNSANSQSFGIRYPRVSRLPQLNNDANSPEQLLPPRDALASADNDQMDRPDAIRQEEKDTDHSAEQGTDTDSDSMFRPIPIVPHAATEDINVVQAAMKKQPGVAEAAPREAGPVADVHGANAADEALLQTRQLTIPEEYAWKDNVFISKEAAEPADEGQFLDSDLVHDVPALESLNLPSTLLLTVVTPVQLMGLLAEFPVSADPSEDGAEVAEFSESE
jgi:hypothetical protein